MAWHKVNSLDVQLDEFLTSDKQASKQITNKIQVRDRDHREVETRDTMIYSRSSFLLRGSTSMLERCGDTESTNATEASSFPLNGRIGGTDRNPYMELGARIHNSIGGSQECHGG
jgi:hypothetical protein